MALIAVLPLAAWAHGAAVVLVKVVHERHLIGLQEIGYPYVTI